MGNVRTVIKKIGSTLSTIQTRHYYSFGMEMSQLNVSAGPNRYQYNGKEIQDDFGLYWYDYGARFYDPMIGRWHTVDPKAESMHRWSPYNYTLNNPVNLIDPDGQLPGIPREWAMAAAIWLSGKGGALKRLISGKSGEINAPTGYVPERTQQMSKSIGVAKDGTTVANGLVDVAEATMESVNTIPGVDVIGDPLLAGYYGGIKGDKEAGASYALASGIPGASGLLFRKGAKELNAGKNAVKMSLDEIGEFLEAGKNWHDGSAKRNYLNQFKKELKGDTNADFYKDKDTKEVFLKSNKSGNWVNTGQKLE